MCFPSALHPAHSVNKQTETQNSSQLCKHNAVFVLLNHPLKFYPSALSPHFWTLLASKIFLALTIICAVLFCCIHLIWISRYYTDMGADFDVRGYLVLFVWENENSFGFERQLWASLYTYEQKKYRNCTSTSLQSHTSIRASLCRILSFKVMLWVSGVCLDDSTLQ